MREINQTVNCTASNIKKASRLVVQHYDRYLKPTGLRITQFTLLSTIEHMGSPTITDLAKQMVTDRTTLTRNLALLERDELLLNGDSSDRRIRKVTLTGKGRKILAEATPLWHEAQQSIANELGERQWNDLIDLLGKLQKVF